MPISTASYLPRTGRLSQRFERPVQESGWQTASPHAVVRRCLARFLQWGAYPEPVISGK
jgi:hypothetical protein